MGKLVLAEKSSVAYSNFDCHMMELNKTNGNFRMVFGSFNIWFEVRKILCNRPR